MKNKENIHYHLQIENGKIIKEEGHFFRATPFTIIKDTCHIHCEFTHKDHEVVYKLSENNNHLINLEHPDYLPDVAPEELNTILKCSKDSLFIIEALFQLKIAKSSIYSTYLKKQKPTSYSVIQEIAAF
ncbi:MAG: hypothetical protein VW378_03745 [bacterium]